jgi:hypothetical protein
MIMAREGRIRKLHCRDWPGFFNRMVSPSVWQAWARVCPARDDARVRWNLKYILLVLVLMGWSSRGQNKRPWKQELRPSEQSARINATFVRRDIPREIRYIIQLAQAEDARIVNLGNLVLFSTRTRDAWLLDAEDGLAARLCREGEPQPFRIIDGPDTLAIEWTATFTIQGTAFIVQQRSGRVVEIEGYPTVDITAACRR